VALPEAHERAPPLDDGALEGAWRRAPEGLLQLRVQRVIELTYPTMPPIPKHGLCRPCRGIPFRDQQQAIEEHNLACAKHGERKYPTLNTST
jgi:hypothetical protein